MKAYITQKDGTVWVSFDLEENGNRIWFSHSARDKASAEAIRLAVETAVQDRVQWIRTNAYFRGRRSMRDKSERVTVFTKCINIDNLGYDAHSGCKG